MEAIADKPGSHRHCAALVGAGLLAMQTPRSVRQTAVKPSRASPAPTDIAPLLWERACSRCRRHGLSGKPHGSHRGQARLPQTLRRTCGSGLARDAGATVCQANRGEAIAGKPGSHRNCAVPTIIYLLRRICLFALRANRTPSISAAQVRPTIKPCHSPLGPLAGPNQSVSPSA